MKLYVLWFIAMLFEEVDPTLWMNTADPSLFLTSRKRRSFRWQLVIRLWQLVNWMVVRLRQLVNVIRFCWSRNLVKSVTNSWTYFADDC